MNEQYITIAGISFLAMLTMSIWPRQCIDKAKKILERKGENPNQKVTFKRMKELDSKLYKQYLTGLFIWIPCCLLFVGFTLLAVFKN